MTLPERFRASSDDKRGLRDRTAGFVKARRARKRNQPWVFSVANKWVDSDPLSPLLGNTVKLRRCDMHNLDSRAKCNRALREPDLHVFAKVFEDCLKRSLEAKAFSGREIGGDDDVLDFLVGHFVDVDLTRQPAS